MARIEERDYQAESSGEFTGRALQAIPRNQVVAFNRDYDRLIDEELSARAARFLEMGREVSFELTRHVMNRANQNYGGSLASGDEVGIRLIRPRDMVRQTAGTPVAAQTANSWQFTWAGPGVLDAFGEAADATQQVNLGDQSNAEAMLIVGWSNDHPAPKTEAIQASKFNRNMVAQALPWDVLTSERASIRVMEANPWFVALPGETFQFSVRNFATGEDVLRPLGTWVQTGTQLRTL
jgi:hypothetical protein